LDIPHHQREIIVGPEHIDNLGHVNNVVYLKWALEMAGEHWFASANSEDKERYRWVVRRHEIDYLKPAFLNDQLTAFTWVDEMGGVQSLRRVQIKRGNELIMNALTKWILIDAKTGNLTRIPEHLTRLYIP
jgi:acyl-CoA thioester hydrolase